MGGAGWVWAAVATETTAANVNPKKRPDLTYRAFSPFRIVDVAGNETSDSGSTHLTWGDQTG
jgi:hypothetical protein